VVLARFAIAGEDGEAQSSVVRDLLPLTGRGKAETERKKNLLEMIQSLFTQEYLRVAEKAGGKKPAKAKKPSRFAATAEGKSAAMVELGFKTLPQGTKWPALRDKSLSALALGIESPSDKLLTHISKASGFQAVLLLHLYAGDDQTFATVNTLPTLTRAAEILAAKVLSPPRAGVKHLRDALLARWVEQAGALQSEDTETVAALDFAQAALMAARESPTGKFGPDKVFISHAWRQFNRMHPRHKLELEEFKGKLLAAHRERELTLARADLVPALEFDDVMESELMSMGATFNFIEV